MLKKPLGYTNSKNLRESINKFFNSRTNNLKKESKIEFINSEVLAKPIDYYYSNPIARSSKVMNECRKISKKFLFTGIEKAS